MVARSDESHDDALVNILVETLAPLARTTYLSIDHTHPFMETVIPGGCGLSWQDNATCHKAKMVQEEFEEQNNELEVLTWPPNSPEGRL